MYIVTVPSLSITLMSTNLHVVVSLKWKPADMNTVDFRISVTWSKEHKPIYSLQVVTQGKNYKFYDHLQLEQETALE